MHGIEYLDYLSELERLAGENCDVCGESLRGNSEPLSPACRQCEQWRDIAELEATAKWDASEAVWALQHGTQTHDYR